MMTSTPPAARAEGFAEHDHSGCVAAAMAAAEARCAEAGLNFTPVRRRALEILLREHRAMGAYAVLDALREGGFGSQPPVAYRALDFLLAQGFAHRIERLNAFVACARPGRAHAPAFMICRACDAVAETCPGPARATLDAAAAARGFVVERMVIEAEGLCPACADGAAP
jgi:Fur family zinc uptake transcriptional regulator